MCGIWLQLISPEQFLENNPIKNCLLKPNEKSANRFRAVHSFRPQIDRKIRVLVFSTMKSPCGSCIVVTIVSVSKMP